MPFKFFFLKSFVSNDKSFVANDKSFVANDRLPSLSFCQTTTPIHSVIFKLKKKHNKTLSRKRRGCHVDLNTIDSRYIHCLPWTSPCHISSPLPSFIAPPPPQASSWRCASDGTSHHPRGSLCWKMPLKALQAFLGPLARVREKASLQS